ncbi:MAG: hypothetical protein HN526_03625 [Gammaproteobacteria bacterium]|nr:hypothetical protein [Gammaproteobacteria bacterium]
MPLFKEVEKRASTWNLNTDSTIAYYPQIRVQFPVVGIGGLQGKSGAGSDGGAKRPLNVYQCSFEIQNID